VQRRWLVELAQLLAFPTISSEPACGTALQAAARWLADHVARIGLRSVEVLPGPNGGAPSVYGEWLFAPQQPTVLLYGHFDVQPVEPLDRWRTPPFCATLRGENLYARGASDDKGQLFTHLKAVEWLLRTRGRLPVNVKLWLEGEEEIGSPNLATLLAREQARLRADAVLVSDTEMAASGRPAITYGLRGNLSCTLEVHGPTGTLHSGRYGGAVLSPIQALSDLLSGMHRPDGRVAIPGFYDRVQTVSDDERSALRFAAPATAFGQGAAASTAWGESGFSPAERIAIRPALTMTGIDGGITGGAGGAIIPERASARLNLRLVPDQDPEQIARLIARHVARHTPPLVRSRVVFSGAARPVLVPRQHPAVAAAARAVQAVWQTPPAFARSGGSIPAVEALQRRLGVPAVLLGFGLRDDRIHAPNEKLHLPTFFRGVRTVARFLDEYRREQAR
jgi:acetylornithine deacetylase/succinyl-diaminopimelate desuccinylase-like protein